MKITKKQLKSIILNTLNEEYKGIVGGKLKQNPETGEWEREEGPITFDSDEQSTVAASFTPAHSGDFRGTIPGAPGSKQKKGVSRLYSGKMFKKKASWMFGSKSLPNSNVYIIPIAGSEWEATNLMFNYETPKTERDKYGSRRFGQLRSQLSPEELDVAKERGAHVDLQRHLIFDIASEGINILTNLGVNIGEMKAINKEKDIIFVPITSGTAARFTGTPHLMMHALFDPGASTTKTADFFDHVISYYFSMVDRPIQAWGKSKGMSYREVEEILYKLGTTNAYRKGMIDTNQDAFAEMLTQEMTKQRANTMNRFPLQAGLSFNREIFDSFPPDIQASLVDFRRYLQHFMNEYKKSLQGKIVIINQF